MTTINIIKIGRLLNIVGAIGLIIWWFSMPVLLPITDSVENFKNLILNANWIPINILGLVSVFLLTLGFPVFYLTSYDKFNKLGFYSLLIVLTGLILFSCIQYYETIIWPAAAQINPDLVQLKGALVSGDNAVKIGLLISGIFLGLGYILFGVSALKTKEFSNTSLWLLIIGAPLFGNGIVFSIRTFGIVLFCLGTIMLAKNIRKE